MKPTYPLGDYYAMRTTGCLIVLSAYLLAGCTVPLLPDLNANLKSVNASLRSVNDGLRGASSTPPATVSAATPDVCDQAAFEVGFKDQYVVDWNSEIGRKEALYRLQSKQHPEDAAVRQNYALYRGKLLSGKGVGDKAIEYGLKFDNNGHIQNDCQARSYQEGKIAGGAAAVNNFKALAAQEV